MRGRGETGIGESLCHKPGMIGKLVLVSSGRKEYTCGRAGRSRAAARAADPRIVPDPHVEPPRSTADLALQTGRRVRPERPRAAAPARAARMTTHESNSSRSVTIRAENLSKIYGDFAALHSVTFQVRKGTVAAFLGPNGAG